MIILQIKQSVSFVHWYCLCVQYGSLSDIILGKEDQESRDHRKVRNQIWSLTQKDGEKDGGHTAQ